MNPYHHNQCGLDILISLTSSHANGILSQTSQCSSLPRNPFKNCYYMAATVGPKYAFITTSKLIQFFFVNHSKSLPSVVLQCWPVCQSCSDDRAFIWIGFLGSTWSMDKSCGETMFCSFQYCLIFSPSLLILILPFFKYFFYL
jgi:hypothetical protein